MLALTACGIARDQLSSGSVTVQGVQPTLEQISARSTQAAQNDFIATLIENSGVDQSQTPSGNLRPTNSAEWSVVAKQGVYEISRQCDQYLYVLFRFNRNQSAIRQGLSAVGAGTATILGLSGVAAGPIAITAAAFGLTASLFDASVTSVLFTLEPSALRNVVLQGQQRYLKKTDFTQIRSRPDALIALQGYLNQCTPAAIEANVNRSASGASSVSSTDDAQADDAAVLAGPASVLITTYGPDLNTPILRAFLFPSGTLNSANQTALLAAMQRAGVTNVSPVLFTNSARYKSQRAAVVKDLGLSN